MTNKQLKSQQNKEYDREMNNFAIAIAKSFNASVFVRSMFECGWAVCTRTNEDSYGYDEYSSIIDAMKRFKQFSKEHKIKTVLIQPWLLDTEDLRQIDEDKAKYEDQAAYEEAMMYAEYSGDDSMLRRYYRRHGIEYDG